MANSTFSIDLGGAWRLTFTLRHPEQKPNEPSFGLEGLCPRAT